MIHLLTTLLFGLALFRGPVPGTLPDVKKPVPDGRAIRLTTFFQIHQCPAPYHVEDYLRAADIYSVDYRLLPAISFRESTCGEYCRLNNHWGWDSARTGFASVRSGIYYVMSQLAYGKPYKGTSLDQKLYEYNPRPSYAIAIKQTMREIGE